MRGPGLTGPRNSIGQVGALLFGVGYLAAGVIGFFVTGFGGFVADGNASLLGFELNGLHNVVHLGVGGLLVLAARLDRAAAEGALIGLGLFYVVAAFLGFDNKLQIISMNGTYAVDNFLHVVSALTILGIGIASTLVSARMERSRDAVQQA